MGDRQGQGNLNCIKSSFEEHKVTFIAFADEWADFTAHPGQSTSCY